MKRLLLILALSIVTISARATEPTLNLGSGGASLTDVQLGRKFSWVGAVRERIDGLFHVRIVSGVDQASGSEISLGTGFDPACSVWSIGAVDESTAIVRLGDRCGSEETIEFTAIPGRHQIVVKSSVVFGQYIAAGDSAYSFALRDGSELDADGKINDEIAIELGSMIPSEVDTEAPQTIAAGDRVLLVDPEHMRAAAAEVEP
jgi:hypothetical protein